jgi:predicted membrane channel-forming protein YqfA (hemolysin III family)
MPDTAPNAELLRSLGRLVRGLSALFWGLPVALIVCVQTAETQAFHSFNVLPPVAATAWLVYGLWHLGQFQKQERIWVRALDRAKILALVDLGLSPFLYWWSQKPGESFYLWVILALAGCGLLFLSSLNLVLYRLSTMLPDEGLREETRHFTTLNRVILAGLLLFGGVVVAVMQYPEELALPFDLDRLLGAGGLWLMIFLTLLPLAMTMALLWKIKQVILDSVFGAGR